MFKMDLLENEKVLALYRQTEWVLIKPVLIISLFIYLPWFFLLKYELANDYRKLLFFWTAALLAYGIYKYLLWLLNLYMVTNKRLVSVKYQTLVKKKIAETPIGSITNISFNTTGLFSTLFDFGDVEVKFGSAGESMILKNAREPAKLKDFLWQQCNPQANPVFTTGLAGKSGLNPKNLVVQAQKPKKV